MAQGVDQLASGWEVPHGLGDECLAQRQTILWRATVADPAVARQVLARIASFADGDELAMLVIEFAEFIFQLGKEPSLNGVPEVGQLRESVHGSSPGLKAWIAHGRDY